MYYLPFPKKLSGVDLFIIDN
jgi:hypothetical protein